MAIKSFEHNLACEFGLIGVLLVGKYSNFQVLLSAICVNIIGMIGVLSGLGAGSLNKVVYDYFMIFLAGNFAYIAIGIIKTLMKKDAKTNVLEFISLCKGIFIMFMIGFRSWFILLITYINYLLSIERTTQNGLFI